MKRIFTLCLSLVLLASSAFAGEPKFTPRKAFSNLGIALNAGTSGYGFSLATPIAKHFNLRGGYVFSPHSFKYTYDDFGTISVPSYGSVAVPDLDLTANLETGNAHIMVDWVPFKKGTGAFFVTAGVFMGNSKIICLDGQFDMSTPEMQTLKQYGMLHEVEVEVGDQIIRIDDSGHVDAALKVNSVRPYIGLGWGRAIPKHRFGFRFEMGVSMLGKTKIFSDNLVNTNSSGELSDINKFLNKVTVLPHISFALTYRIFKDK